MRTEKSDEDFTTIQIRQCVGRVAPDFIIKVGRFETYHVTFKGLDFPRKNVIFIVLIYLYF